MKLKYLKLAKRNHNVGSYLMVVKKIKGKLYYTANYYVQMLDSDPWFKVDVGDITQAFSLEDWIKTEYTIQWITQEEMFAELL